jgi:hypothetical protein
MLCAVAQSGDKSNTESSSTQPSHSHQADNAYPIMLSHVCSLLRTLLAAKRVEMTPVLAIASSLVIIATSRSVMCCHPNLSHAREARGRLHCQDLVPCHNPV